MFTIVLQLTQKCMAANRQRPPKQANTEVCYLRLFRIGQLPPRVPEHCPPQPAQTQLGRPEFEEQGSF